MTGEYTFVTGRAAERIDPPHPAEARNGLKEHGTGVPRASRASGSAFLAEAKPATPAVQ
jgi:hypothetical protein